MPRNPNKRHCQMPGCRAWAMRDHVHCRSHRDRELGPRNAGAPYGNLNAAKHGRYSKRQSADKLRRMAHEIAYDPDNLPMYINNTIQEIHAQSPCPTITLLFLRKLITPLVHTLAEALFTAELGAFLEELAPHNRPAVKSHLWKSSIKLPPVERLMMLRQVLDEISEKTIHGRTINGTDGKKS
jgi:hypothetical protein